jgi:UDP-N-acetyl-D-mannosaminuronic acid dehydrogenase
MEKADAMEKICVLGLGYIGLPTASVLASNGYRVLGVDVSPSVVNTVNAGNIHIEEPGLHMVVRAATQSGNLRAALEPEPCDVFIVAVPTPLNADKTADMTYVRRATESIVPHLRRGALVILESTSPPGTCTDLMLPILEMSGLRAGEDFYLAHCPERVLPGRILKELIENDRVIGGFDAASAERARELYASFVEGKIFLTNATTAEMVKLAENTFRDVNIALANEMARLCEGLGIDFWEMARYANRHPRVNIHSAGPGVGGHCISVDPWFLVEKDPAQAKLIHLARTCNDAVPDHVAGVVRQLVAGIESPKIAILGLAYKGNVDDTRESPALHILELLRDAGLDTAVYDPHVNMETIPQAGLDAALGGADCVVLLTDHAEYRDISPERAAGLMRRPVLYDTRNQLDHDAWRAAGFTVRVLGRG